MYDQDVINLPPEVYENMPTTIESGDPLLNVGKKELLLALRIARENPAVADWLFKQSSQPFHNQATLPPEAFENSLAIHLHHSISTPPQFCPTSPSAPPSPSPNPITKDFDFLLVPVSNIENITLGYCFLNRLSSPVSRSPFSSSAKNFFPGRFAFDNHCSDFLASISDMFPIMIGLISMRYSSATTRDRSFFVIPKSDYGSHCLPSRVLSMQSNQDYVVPSTPKFQFSANCRPSPSKSTPSSNPPTNPSSDLPSNMQSLPNLSMDSTFADVLEAISTVISDNENLPSPDLFPELLSSADHLSSDVSDVFLPDALSLDPLHYDTFPSDTLPSDTLSSSACPSQSSTLPSQCSTLPSLSPPTTIKSPPNFCDSWLVSSDPGTPDGVGIPRRPGSNGTSSGAFDMCALYRSLAKIERSLKGHFFSPKVCKDIMHPQTGELFSRRTGKLVTKLEAVESSKLRIFQNVAAQIYYGSHLPVSTDRALVSAQTHMRLGRSGKRVRSVGLSSTPASSPVPILAPRPDEATNGGVNWILQASGNNTGKSVEEEKEEAKREAKRIKNRMSAARSNQKRRLHLESQRRELASLSGRVEELQGKKKQILEENEKLRKQLLKA